MDFFSFTVHATNAPASDAAARVLMLGVQTVAGASGNTLANFQHCQCAQDLVEQVTYQYYVFTTSMPSGNYAVLATPVTGSKCKNSDCSYS